MTGEDQEVFEPLYLPSNHFYIRLSSHLKLYFSGHEKCGISEFRCKNGQCISHSLHCDGSRDCLDHSDEEGCPAAGPLRCPPGEVACPRSGECVLAEWICDHDLDCKDGSDEKVVHSSLRKIDFSPQR